MSKGPLFSTYRQGENRVTASMLAVFERIDLALVERLLGAASGESELQMVRFRNQVAGDDSVPDAGISAHFNYLFEVKTAREAVGVRQLRAHLSSLSGEGDQRLFVVTPDVDEPEQVAALRNDGESVSWIGFLSLAAAIDEALSEPGGSVSEREAFLLRELVRLFEADGLLGSPEDVVIVAAGTAYPFYQRYRLYVCQAGRSFSADVKRMGFYRGKAIQREVPEILWHGDGFDISAESIAALAAGDDSAGRSTAGALRDAVERGAMEMGWQAQVFLLSAPDDGRTLKLSSPILHPGGTAWTQKQRYVSSEALQAEPATTEELETA